MANNIDIHFIKDEVVLGIINSLLATVSSNFNVPYDMNSQPTNGALKNFDSLVKFNLPAGVSMAGSADASVVETMSTAINSLMASLAPFMAAYGMILPILGVIRGIIDVLCALMNPFAVIRAMIRLLNKWLPEFLSLFPVFAGIVMIISIIKLVIAVMMQIMLVVIPFIQMIISNIRTLSQAFGPDGTDEQRNAIKEKLLALVIELLNQLGLLELLKPIIGVVSTILEFAAGLPCKDGDSTCCNENVCPSIFKNPPKGNAFMVATTYADAALGSAWLIVPVSLVETIKIRQLIPYCNDIESQLKAQGNPIKLANHAGQTGDNAPFKVSLTGKRGTSQAIITPIVEIDNSILVIDPRLAAISSSLVKFEVQPNWDVLVANGIIGLGCHPEISAALNNLAIEFKNYNKPIKTRFPKIASLSGDINNISSILNNNINKLKLEVDDVVGKIPPYDDNINNINTIQADIIKSLSDFVTDLKNTMRDVLSGAVSNIKSEFDVNKNIVIANGTDKAIIQVIPKDDGGNLLLKDLPSDIDITVSLINDFGTITNKSSDKTTGIVTAEISSLLVGTAKLKAKINSNYISVLSNGVVTEKEIEVRFVSDAALPKRRLVSKLKADQDKHNIVGPAEIRPGGK